MANTWPAPSTSFGTAFFCSVGTEACFCLSVIVLFSLSASDRIAGTSCLACIWALLPIVFFTFSAVLCWVIAYKDIRVSSILTLVLEGASVACILALAFVILFKHGFKVDTGQLSLKGVGLHGMGLAVVACIFSLVGFESATALGGEAKDAKRTVPKAVTASPRTA